MPCICISSRLVQWLGPDEAQCCCAMAARLARNHRPVQPISPLWKSSLRAFHSHISTPTSSSQLVQPTLQSEEKPSLITTPPPQPDVKRELGWVPLPIFIRGQSYNSYWEGSPAELSQASEWTCTWWRFYWINWSKTLEQLKSCHRLTRQHIPTPQKKFHILLIFLPIYPAFFPSWNPRQCIQCDSQTVTHLDSDYTQTGLVTPVSSCAFRQYPRVFNGFKNCRLQPLS